MRALFSDFPVTDIGDEYMFGKSILVVPVISEVKRRSLYLPEGTQWIDFWTGEKQKGGQEIIREAPIDIIPLYVKAGSIIPAGPSVQFATRSHGMIYRFASIRVPMGNLPYMKTRMITIITKKVNIPLSV